MWVRVAVAAVVAGGSNSGVVGVHGVPVDGAAAVGAVGGWRSHRHLRRRSRTEEARHAGGVVLLFVLPMEGRGGGEEKWRREGEGCVQGGGGERELKGRRWWGCAVRMCLRGLSVGEVVVCVCVCVCARGKKQMMRCRVKKRGGGVRQILLFCLVFFLLLSNLRNRFGPLFGQGLVSAFGHTQGRADFFPFPTRRIMKGRRAQKKSNNNNKK